MSALILTERQSSLANKLDMLAESGVACLDAKQGFERAMLTALCVGQLKEALTEEVMAPIMSLQGSMLGFRTDKDNQGGYPLNVVKEALINAVMVGLLPCGNQFNILAGRMYITKEGFTYLLDKLGVAYRIDLGVPVSKNGGALVHADIVWQDKAAQTQTKALDIPVRVNNGMGTDAILGKADRKAKCWLYNNLTHSTLSDGDVDEEARPVRNVTPTAAPMQASKLTPAHVVATEAEPSMEVPPSGSDPRELGFAPKGRQPEDGGKVRGTASDWARLERAYLNKVGSFKGFCSWLQSHGVQAPSASDLQARYNFAAWFYLQSELVEAAEREGIINPTIC